MQLTTKRLTLYPATLDNVDALHALWRDPSVRRYLLDDREISRQETEEFVQAFVRSQRSSGFCLWMVEALTDAALVGFAAIRQIPKTTEVELYYGLALESWGKGLATEAATAVLQYGFDVLGLPRIWARTDPPNAASMRVAERLGMTAAADPGETALVSYVIDRRRWSE